MKVNETDELYEFECHLYNIKTEHIYPPIPFRGNDWCAYYAGEEELNHYGWGRTREDAIQNLKDNYDPEDLP
jgi:hypothetical protein